MTTNEPTQAYHDQARQFFENLAQQTAREKKFVRRTSPLDGRLFLLSLVLTVFEHGTLVLDQLAVSAHRINSQVRVTGQAFKERYTAAAVAWLQAMLASALHLTLPQPATVVPLLSIFSAVYLLDSSSVALPDSLQKKYPGCGGAGAKAAVKLYLLLNWLTGAYETMQLEAGRKADQNMGERFLAGRLPGALWLFDLGFFKLFFLSAIAQAKSYFLCRLYGQLTLWSGQAAGALEKLDLDRLLRGCHRELFECAVVLGPQQAVSARLILAPVPKAQANARRRRAREAARRQGRTPSQRTLRRCDWTLLLTNTSAAQLPTSTVLEVYRVRWQVELAFKLCKSDAQLANSKATEKHRAECEFYARLIALLFFNRISGLVERSLGEKISPAKLWRRMRGEAQQWLSVLGQGTLQAVTAWFEFLARYARPGVRKKDPSTLQRLEMAAHRAQQVELADPLGCLREKRKTVASKPALIRPYCSTRKVEFVPERLSFQRTHSLP